MFPVKHTVIYTFFAITSVQNTCFCSVFNALASKNPAKSCYVQCFFSFLAVFPLPESYQNDPKFHFNTLLRSDTQKSSKNVENTTVFWSRCETVFGPPPAKADIATAILTNVIEHLVLLFCPPISTPSPPKRCGRIYPRSRNHEKRCKGQHAGNSFQFRSSGHSSSDSSDCWCWSTGNFRCFGSPCRIGTVNKFQVSKKTIWCFSSHFNPKSSLTLGYYAPKSLNALEFPLKTTQITFDPLRQRLVGGFCTFETAQLFVQLVSCSKRIIP